MTNPFNLVYAVFALLIAANIYGWQELNRSHHAAAAARSNLAACERLAVSIKSLKQKPALARSLQHEMTDLIRRIEEAATSASIPLERLVRIDPQTPKRLGNSSYQEHAAILDIDGVSLRQLITFLHLLASNESGLDAQNIQLIAPRDPAALEQWNCGLVLTYLIYSPTSPTSGNIEGK